MVCELMGLHTLNPVSGDFSLGAKGVRIENGREGGAVSGVTIAGNLLDMLKKIAAVGSDIEFFGATGAPTLLVEDITVAGN
jgi:PmbA protein